MLYSLVATRDGKLIEAFAVLDTMRSAEIWAFRLMMQQFELNASDFEELDDVWAETDGGRLKAIPDGWPYSEITPAAPAST